jgi:flagellar motor protein MotB
VGWVRKFQADSSAAAWTGLVTILLGLSGLAGCADNPLVLQGKLNQFEQQQVALTRQQEQLQARSAALDQNNQELEALVAQSRQQADLLEKQLQATREQLRSATAQLAEVREERQSADNQVKALQASLRQRGSVLITPNTSGLSELPQIGLPGVEVRRDGEVIRVELSGARMFESGDARLRPGAEETLAGVAAELARLYPRQIIGVEGHTDTDPVVGGGWRSNHQLSTARAMAVYDVLASRTALEPRQLFVVGHGPNHPVVSNASDAGKQRNRRVELVVYPEQTR